MAAKKANSDHWFYSKSPAAQKAYIAAHPNSIYAKKATPKGKTRTKKEATDARREWKADRKKHKEVVKGRAPKPKRTKEELAEHMAAAVERRREFKASRRANPRPKVRGAKARLQKQLDAAAGKTSKKPSKVKRAEK